MASTSTQAVKQEPEQQEHPQEPTQQLADYVAFGDQLYFLRTLERMQIISFVHSPGSPFHAPRVSGIKIHVEPPTTKILGDYVTIAVAATVTPGEAMLRQSLTAAYDRIKRLEKCLEQTTLPDPNPNRLKRFRVSEVTETPKPTTTTGFVPISNKKESDADLLLCHETQPLLYHQDCVEPPRRPPPVSRLTKEITEDTTIDALADYPLSDLFNDEAWA